MSNVNDAAIGTYPELASGMSGPFFLRIFGREG
jgi:hypothetical protein